MESLRAWLCPTPAHRVRVIEASARIGKARIIIAGAIALGVLAGAPWNGWWTVALFVPAGLHLITMDRWMERSATPELVAFGTLLTMMLVLVLPPSARAALTVRFCRGSRSCRPWPRCAFAWP